jgi:hypothetical protein
MATMWWKGLADFERDLGTASDEKVEVMRRWASDKEDSADAPGMGRAPKARRHFRQMREAAEQELSERGRW